MLDTNGVVTTLAGNAGITQLTDGVGTNANFQFYNYGIAVDTNGNVYVPALNTAITSTIKKIDTSGDINCCAAAHFL